jgi:leucyl-tRNA synthetase
VVRLRREGAQRFLRRLWRITFEHVSGGAVAALDVAALTSDQKAVRRELHKTIAKVSDDVGRRQTFNTAIAAIMELMNNLAKLGSDAQDRALMQEALEAVVVMLYPITPHIGFELWKMLGKEGDIDVAAGRWPTKRPWSRPRSWWWCRSTARCAAS